MSAWRQDSQHFLRPFVEWHAAQVAHFWSNVKQHRRVPPSLRLDTCMQSALPPPNEAARLQALLDLDVLDSGPEEEFDALVKVASLVCSVPISLISLIDTERQWFKANIGLPGVSETPRDVAFCAHAILDDALFEVPDASQDARFFDNPLVAALPDIRFYAGAPITLSDGNRIGTLCVIDRQPNQLTSMQREVLHALAVAAAQALEGRRAIRARHAIEEKLRQEQSALYEAQERVRLANESGGIGIWDLNLTTGVLLWDAQTYRLYGLEPDVQDVAPACKPGVGLKAMRQGGLHQILGRAAERDE